MASEKPLHITLFTHPQSRARICRWMLEETGLEYEAQTVEYGPAMKSPEYRAMNPMGKVPTLKVNDQIVTEVGAICSYLADLVPHKKLAPALDDPARGAYHRWLYFVAGPLNEIITAKSTGKLADPQMAGYGRYEDVLDTLSHAVKGKTYLCGNDFSAADLLMVANLRWYLAIKALDPRPEFKEYVAQHAERPAGLRAFELDGPIEMPD